MCCSKSGAAAAKAAAAAATAALGVLPTSLADWCLDACRIEYNTHHMFRVLVDDALIFCSRIWLDAPCPLLKFSMFLSEWLTWSRVINLCARLHQSDIFRFKPYGRQRNFSFLEVWHWQVFRSPGRIGACLGVPSGPRLRHLGPTCFIPRAVLAHLGPKKRHL